MEFKDFNIDNKIIKALYNMQYNEPSKVQVKVIPSLLEHRNVIVKSKTGTGKTASFGVPICEKVEISKNCIQALVMVPTRELAIQVKDEINNIGRIKSVRCSAIFGKQSIKEQTRELKQRIHVVVGTPGRIIDHIDRGNIKLEKIKYFIIDEADKMLNKGFVEDMEYIFSKLPKESTKALFSATIDNDIKIISDKYIVNSEIIDIKTDEKQYSQIIEKYMKSSKENKYTNLKNIIYNKNPKTTIIFCNTRKEVDNIYMKMNKDKFYVRQIHGEMTQEKRIHTIEDFKKGKFNVLVSTDVAGRGIHIDDISLIINYDVPNDRENYVHRIGRTGRKKSYGSAISIVTSNQEKSLKEIEEYIGYKIEEINELSKMNIDVQKNIFEENTKGYIRQNRNIKKKEKVNEEIVRIYINAGKKKKIRVVDIVGAFSNLPEINNEDIGVIEVQELCSYVDILNNKGINITKKYREISIKNKKVQIRKDRN